MKRSPGLHPGAAWAPAHGLRAEPHRCGFPDGTNTGVPGRGHASRKVPGQVSRGPGWYYDHRGFVAVVGTGAVLSGLSIPCGVSVTASHVTIRDVRIVTSGQSAMGVALRHVHDVTIEHSTIAGTNTGSGGIVVEVKDVYGDATGTEILANNIFQGSTGVQIYQGRIQGNYIHHLGMIPGDHVNGVTTNGDTRPLAIRHNTIFVSYAQTDAIGLFQDFRGGGERDHRRQPARRGRLRTLWRGRRQRPAVTHRGDGKPDQHQILPARRLLGACGGFRRPRPG